MITVLTSDRAHCIVYRGEMVLFFIGPRRKLGGGGVFIVTSVEIMGNRCITDGSKAKLIISLGGQRRLRTYNL